MRVKQHFHTDKSKHDRQADFQTAKITERAGQQKIHRAQADDGKNVRGKNDEGLARDGKNRRDGIHGENQIGRLDEQQHQRQRCECKATVEPGEKSLAVEVRRHSETFSREPQREVFFRLHGFLAGKKHLKTGKNEKCAEDVKHPVELVDQFRAGGNHRAAHDERAENAPKKQAMLKFHRDAKPCKNERNNEDVVERQ